MRILLPPSEGKTTPAGGPRLGLSGLSFPGLDAPRRRVADELIRLCRSDPQDAARVLRLGPTQASAVSGNASLRRAPTAPAAQVYCGVLFAALGLAALPTAATDRILIASALFGLLTPTDAIPSYRLSGAVRLPGLPAPKAVWGPPLRAVLMDLAQHHLIVDLRSSPYAGWSPAGVSIRVVTLRDGRRVPISHHNKAVKGALARVLATGPELETTAALVGRLQHVGWAAELTGPATVEVLHTPTSA